MELSVCITVGLGMKTENLNNSSVTKYSFITMVVFVLIALASVGNFYNQNYNFKGKLQSGGFLETYTQLETNNQIAKEEKNV